MSDGLSSLLRERKKNFTEASVLYICDYTCTKFVDHLGPWILVVIQAKLDAKPKARPRTTGPSKDVRVSPQIITISPAGSSSRLAASPQSQTRVSQASSLDDSFEVHHTSLPSPAKASAPSLPTAASVVSALSQVRPTLYHQTNCITYHTIPSYDSIHRVCCRRIF